MKICTLDYHTGGEPLRIITDGIPDLNGGSMLERRRYFSENLDAVRRLLMLEPRGHADMYGAVLTPPATEDGDVGVLFMHNEGYSTMCGHGIIALVTAGLEHGLFKCRNPDRVLIDSPAGRIEAVPHWQNAQAGSGKVASVSFRNVPSFVLQENLPLAVDSNQFKATVAFGGAFYAYVQAEDFDLLLVPDEAAELVRLGREIKHLVSQSTRVMHPTGDDDLSFLYGVIFVRSGEDVGRSRNVCVFADGEIDRSPTGTGVSGRAAIHFQRSEIGLDEEIVIESLIGTRFSVRCVEKTNVGDFPAIIPEVTGSAHICGRSEFEMDPDDPLADGFMIR